jgi:methionyl aminopeptidase
MPGPHIFTDREIPFLRLSGAILHDCLAYVRGLVRVGITTGELDQAGEAFIRDRDGVPAFKGYRGFPATLCISLNDECVHGIPNDRALKEGDMYHGAYSDACVTVPVGHASPDAIRLIQATERALAAGIAAVHGGCRVGDISHAVQTSVEGAGFTVIRALTGHGVGGAVHQFPDIPNFGKPGAGPVLPAGAVIAIEPIVSAGSGDIRELADGWTLASLDGSLTSHAEHTVLVTEEGCTVLT